MSCVFCQIIEGSLEAEVVYRDSLVTAFLDHRPLFPGHVLVVPNRHIETLPELPVEAVGPFFQEVQRVAEVVPRVLQAQGTFVAMNNKVSQSVPHLHCHVVPRSKKDGLKGFFWPRNPYKDEQHRAQVGLILRQALEANTR